MAFKTILVHCDADRSIPQRLDIAGDMAQQFGAHLVGMHVRPPFQSPALFDGSFVLADLLEIYEKNRKADEATALSAFVGKTKERNFTSEIRVVDGDVDRELATNARYADLLIVGQSNPDAPTATPLDLPETVAMSSGRPTLVVPHDKIKRRPGKIIVVCWNGSREAALAASAALPLLKEAEKVALLVACPTKDETDAHGDAAAAWLARHGVRAELVEDSSPVEEVEETILSYAADKAADLLVMGIYGHTRVREMILGGVSRSLLARSPFPLFTAH